MVRLNYWIENIAIIFQSSLLKKCMCLEFLQGTCRTPVTSTVFSYMQSSYKSVPYFTKKNNFCKNLAKFLQAI